MKDIGYAAVVVEEVEVDVEDDVDVLVEVEVELLDVVLLVVEELEEVLEEVLEEDEVVVHVNWSACKGLNSAILFQRYSVTITRIELKVKPFFLLNLPNN